MDLDKAWHGIHFLLTGSAWDGEGPLAYLLVGGRTVGEEDVGYGPARALSSAEVAAFDDALSKISMNEFRRRFDPKALLRAEIYPEIWLRDPEEDTLGYLVEYFERLKQFVSSARKAEVGLILSLG
jgi:hypothetical protein